LPLPSPAPPAKSRVAVGPPPVETEACPRAVMPCLGLDCRCDSFDEVELGLDEEAALAEARRCLRCGREEQD
jgi:formate dehydrogenase major subunit